MAGFGHHKITLHQQTIKGVSTSLQLISLFDFSILGDKFYHLLLCFSSFVLKEEIKKIANKEDIVLPWPNTSSTAKSFPLHISKILTTKVALATERYLQCFK